MPTPPSAPAQRSSNPGSSIASLWMQVNQDQQSTAPPAPQMPLEQCPNCSHKLHPPLKASGRQVCVKCGWSNRPYSGQLVEQRVEAAPLPDLDLHQLLERAAIESLDNMKPRKKQG
ncbi:MAG TPA: hypothetical protein V6C57_09485 [Coleofasciculaceae cyanobacterium]